MDVGQVTILLRTEQKIPHICILCRTENSKWNRNETKNGGVWESKKVRIKRDRYGYQQQRTMISFPNEKEAAIAIKETHKYKRWKAE